MPHAESERAPGGERETSGSELAPAPAAVPLYVASRRKLFDRLRTYIVLIHRRIHSSQILTRKLARLNYDGDVNGLGVTSVAAATRGFTGADLNALVYEAQLDAVHNALATDAAATQQPRVTDAHLLSVLQTAAPSVSERERQRLQAMCASPALTHHCLPHGHRILLSCCATLVHSPAHIRKQI